MTKLFLSILIFAFQLGGAALVGVGLGMIWPPIAVIYAGAVAFAFGNVLYRAMKSEESSK